MAIFHVIVQNTSKEPVANKVSKTDSLRLLNNVDIISTFSFKYQNYISFSKDICLPGGKNICKNGGSCKITENGEVSCICQKEYTGIHCEDGKTILNSMTLFPKQLMIEQYVLNSLCFLNLR